MLLSKAKIKYIRSLHRKKYRQRYDKFIAEGDKIVLEVLASTSTEIEMLVASPEWLAKHTIPKHISCFEADTKTLAEISTLSTPSEVLLVASRLDFKIPLKDELPPFCIYLDGIQDPGNLGTILRIADWFGINHIFLGEGTVDIYNSKSIQSSMGAFLRVVAIPLAGNELWERYPGIRIMGADMQGDNIFQLADTDKKGILVIGNEGKGISAEMRERIQHWISIPGKGGAESLNAAVACGIICGVMCN